MIESQVVYTCILSQCIAYLKVKKNVIISSMLQENLGRIMKNMLHPKNRIILQEVVNALRSLCETEGIPSYKVLKTICSCGK